MLVRLDVVRSQLSSMHALHYPMRMFIQNSAFGFHILEDIVGDRPALALLAVPSSSPPLNPLDTSNLAEPVKELCDGRAQSEPGVRGWDRLHLISRTISGPLDSGIRSRSS